MCKRYRKTVKTRNKTDKREQRDEDTKRQTARKEWSGRTRQGKRDEFEEKEKDDMYFVKVVCVCMCVCSLFSDSAYFLQVSSLR